MSQQSTTGRTGGNVPYDDMPIPAAKSRLPPAAAPKTGAKRGAVSGINARSKVEAAPIRVPKKSYDLNNLGPDAYPDGEMPVQQQYSAPMGGGDGDLEQCYNCGRSFNPAALARH